MDALERRCGHGGIRNDQSANWSLSARLAHPEANSERFESIEAKLDELRSYLYTTTGDHTMQVGMMKQVRAYSDMIQSSRVTLFFTAVLLYTLVHSGCPAAMH